jgi:phosphate transport system protein
MLTEEITGLKKEIMEYAGLIENMIEKSFRGLIDKESSVLKEIVEKDEVRANSLEIEIDQMCVNLIARFQPAAKDLRVILMALKINNDLERLGDHAVNIAQSNLYLIREKPSKYLSDIQSMAKSAKNMLKDAITSFSNGDIVLARDVCGRDKDINRHREKILKELIEQMHEDTLIIENSLHLLRVSNNLERIGDLSTNICEDVIFMVKGEVIKHHLDEKTKGK